MKVFSLQRTLLGVVLSLFFTLAVTVVSAHDWMAPQEAARINNPLPKTAQTVVIGKELFLENCAVCHGNNGEGLNSEDTGLAKNTPNLTKRLKTHSDGDFYWKIQNGRGDMPGFKDDLSENETWEIIHFIREIKQ